ncbi:MAG: hypothetical protein HY075_07820, partial [Deltaproteobacteria bacterium]|nr:hypothetical protein [Deltaproteobacteria bacterium]
FDKSTGKEREVSTGEFALIREKLGKEGEWANYEVRGDDRTGSFRYFREGARGQNYFLLDALRGLDDVFVEVRSKLGKSHAEVVARMDQALGDMGRIRRGEEAALASQKELQARLASALSDVGAALDASGIKLKKPKNRGPSWDALVESLSIPETALWTTFITARGHPEEHVIEALEVFRALRFFRHIPPAENVYAVSHPKYKGSAASPSAVKAQVMLKLLDRVQAMGSNDHMQDVLTPDAKGARKLHLWGFSDDDFGNYETALKVLSEQMKPSKEYPNGRWPDVKITLFFTGNPNNTKEKPRTVVLTPDGGFRPALASELHEARKINCNQYNARILSYP